MLSTVKSPADKYATAVMPDSAARRCPICRRYVNKAAYRAIRAQAIRGTKVSVNKILRIT